MVVLIALLAATAAFLLGLSRFNLADFASYAAAVRRVIDGHPLYTQLQLAGPYQLQHLVFGAGFAYPPTATLLLLPSAAGEVAGIALDIFGPAALVLAVLAIVRSEYGPLSAPLIAVVLIAILASPLMGDALYVGQITPLLAAGFGLAWLRPRYSGWIGVMAAMVKVYPVLWLLWSLRRRAPLAPPLLLGLLVAAGWTALTGGMETWVDYARATANALPQCSSPSLGSFACALGPSIGVHVAAIVGIATASTLAVVAFRMRNDAVSYALLAVASVLPAPDLFPNYLLVPLVGCVPLICHAAKRAQAKGAVANISATVI
jgi:hypothetical protein